MNKKNMETRQRYTKIPTQPEKLWRKDWCSLGARADYWNGSPWRAIGLSFRP